jgi:hypothetical protein
LLTLSRQYMALLAAALTNHTVAGNFSGPLYGSFLGLYIAPTPVLTPANVLADITPANYTGYARQALAWNPPFINQAGLQDVQSGSLFFAPTDAVTPNTITGCFIASAVTAGILLASAPFPAPGVALAGPTNALSLLIDALLDFGANWGDFLLAD